MESSIGTIAILSVGLFIIYQTGWMKLTQAASEKLNTVSESKLTVWEEASLEAHSKQLGKINAKYEDKSIARSSASVVKASRLALEKVDTDA